MRPDGHRAMDATLITTIKQAARGRWSEILLALGDIPVESLDGKHHSCPVCGGTDRFRVFDDFAETGGVFCNQCHAKKNGDGIAALQWATSRDFPTAVKMLADYLGVTVTQPKKRDKGKLVATYGYTDVNGKVLYQVCRFEPKDFRQRRPKPDGGWSWSAKGVERVPYHLNRIAKADPTNPVLVTEGEKDCDRLWRVSFESETKIVATTCSGGAGKWDSGWSHYFAGRSIVILPDNDKPGRDHARDVAAKLHDSAASIKIIDLPGLPEKGDVSDWLDAGHKIDELLAMVEVTTPVTADEIEKWKKANSKPVYDRSMPDITIEVGPDESRVVDEAIDALATLDDVFQRGGALSHVVDGVEPPKGIARPKDAPRIAAMPYARIRERLADAATWWRPSGDGERDRVHPPEWTIKAIVGRGQWRGIRRLEAIVESPILRADGSILQEPGYDEETGLVFRPQCDFPAIPEKPAIDDARRAIGQVLEVVEDFPFADNAHRAAWLAGVLSPIARYAYDGCTPLFLFDANVRGCGKSLLTDLTSIITLGRPMARMSLPRDDDETRKRITALAVVGEPEILIDNLPPSGFGSPSLDAALTATSWSDRILGQTAMVNAVPLYAVWYATGNNVALVGDLARRVVHIRLESPEENPEERTGFHHVDLVGWTRQHRPQLVTSCLTVLAGYCAAGQPGMGLKPWGSFEAWSALVRNAVVWAGLPDPGSTRTELNTQADREAVALRNLLTGWHDIDPMGRGLTVADLLREIAEYPNANEPLRAALMELAPPRDGRTLNPRSIGMKLHHLRRRVVGGLFLDRRDNYQGSVWFVNRPDSAGTTGTTGTTREYARTGAHTRARENQATPDISPFSPSSPISSDPATCPHSNIAGTPTHDGYVNRTCRDCGANLGCKKQEQQA